MLTSRPMGAALWAAAGVVAFLTARIIPLGRPVRFAPELVVTLVTASILGALATALDFGGWNEPDWRAVTFVFLGSSAALGAMRALPR